MKNLKYTFTALIWVLTNISNFVVAAVSNPIDEEAEPFEVDYPHYTPNSERPGNAAMHDLLHHD